MTVIRHRTFDTDNLDALIADGGGGGGAEYPLKKPREKNPQIQYVSSAVKSADDRIPEQTKFRHSPLRKS